jgi:hypothetical protein
MKKIIKSLFFAIAIFGLTALFTSCESCPFSACDKDSAACAEACEGKSAEECKKACEASSECAKACAADKAQCDKAGKACDKDGKTCDKEAKACPAECAKPCCAKDKK